MDPAAMSTVPDSEDNLYEALPNMNARVSEVYNSVFDEYYSWSYSDSQQAISCLSRPSPCTPPLPKSAKVKKQLNLPTETVSVELCEITDYEYNKSTSHRSSKTKAYPVSPVTLTFDASFRPYPPYTSCTPASQNIFVGDDSHYMPFIPFSDDERYNFANDIELYNYFAWQEIQVDSDEQVIALETMCRLLSNLRLLPKEIDQTQVLPVPCEVLFALTRERDFPKWSPLVTNLKSLIPQSQSSSNPDTIIKYFLDYFCSNSNCLMGFCPTHEEHAVKAQVPDYVLPKNPPVRISDMAAAPCGQDCFLLAVSLSNAIHTHWSETDKQLLSATLRYAPDTLSCDLAVICRKPCREVYRYQVQFQRPIPHIPKGKKQTTRITHLSKGQKQSTMSFDDDDSSLFTPNMPCRHQGPCSADTNCGCYRNRARCRSRCACAKSCAFANRTIVPEDRQAAPVLVQAEYAGLRGAPALEAIWNVTQKSVCPVKQDINSNRCRNVGIQRGDFKSTEVRESEYGLGLYVTETCEEQDLIAEYVGEMICDETVVSRNLHASHKGRSYVFTLNPTYSLDSAYAGNETRYINHSDTPNCSTKVLLVNNEHRIGVYAHRRIAADEELLINYGPAFWGAEKNVADLNGGGGGTQPDPDFLTLLPPSNYIYEDPKDLTYVP